MPLFWIVRDHKGTRSFFIQEASEKIYGWLRSALAGHKGKPAEIHELDKKTARKVPKDMIGKVLSGDEAKRLLKRIEGK